MTRVVEVGHSEPAPPMAMSLGGWAAGLSPGPQDLRLARGALRDTLAVAMAARNHELAPLGRMLGEGGRWAMLAHLLDYDDLHLGSTSHISAVCVPAALAAGGDARAYLAGAGVMARLGMLLGWAHYAAGWHATCTAGAPAAAVAASVALGLDAEGTATAMALAVPAAGGVQGAFGTAAKSLQVGFAVDAGIRAARLAAAGATADPAVLDQWLGLMGVRTEHSADDPVVPGGLAVKAFPCCYALQRPIEAIRLALQGERVTGRDVRTIVVRLSPDVLRPLIHHRPITGLQAKFSLEYALAAAVVDERPALASFTDAAVMREEVRELQERVVIETGLGRGGLLAGRAEVEVRLADRGSRYGTVEVPAGGPGRPMDDAHLLEKLDDCAGREAERIARLEWDTAGEQVRSLLPGGARP